MTTDYRALCAELLDWLQLMDNPPQEVITRARAALAQPEPVGPTDEELLAAQDRAAAFFPPVHPEAEPLSAVEYARELEIREARAVLQRWGRPAITPIPVSERLPEPEDCDAEGRCWVTDRSDGQKWFATWIYESAHYTNGSTHWLPAHALPLPEVEA
jgi:hypothetical protein